MEYLSYLLVAYSTYIVGAASPGPATLSIMDTAMKAGRGPSVILACGVVSGSLGWGVIAILGLTPFINNSPAFLNGLKAVGGLYLLWLAFRAARAATAKSDAVRQNRQNISAHRPRTYFIRGLAIHLTNPQAIFSWATIISLGTSFEAPRHMPLFIVGGCAILGIVIFIAYALIFSTLPMIRAYERGRKYIEIILAVFFSGAAVNLLLSVHI